MMKKFDRSQFAGQTCGELKQLTRQIKAEQDLSKILKDQNEKAKIEKAKKDIQKLVFG